MKIPETITFDDIEYNTEDLTEKAQYFVAQIQSLSEKSNELKMELDQLDIAQKAFTRLLGEEIEEAAGEYIAK